VSDVASSRVPFKRIRRFFQRIKLFFTQEVEDSDLLDVVNKTVSNPSGLIDHVDALRKHLLRSLLAMGIAVGVAFFYAPRVIDLLARPVGGLEALTAIDITEPIAVFMRVSLLLGFAMALPYITLEILLFLAPGLRPKERIYGLIALPAVAIFFIGGVSFAYFVMMPVAIPFLMNFLEVGTEIRPASYITFVTGLLFWVGVAFEFPLVIYVLAVMNIVNHKMLLEHWRIAIVVIAVFSALITPTVDPINMTLVMGPMIILYFFSIFLAFIAQSNRRKTAA
jgi:sec-independent protein translocase protein TatC